MEGKGEKKGQEAKNRHGRSDRCDVRAHNITLDPHVCSTRVSFFILEEYVDLNVR